MDERGSRTAQKHDFADTVGWRKRKNEGDLAEKPPLKLK